MVTLVISKATLEKIQMNKQVTLSSIIDLHKTSKVCIAKNTLFGSVWNLANNLYGKDPIKAGIAWLFIQEHKNWRFDVTSSAPLKNRKIDIVSMNKPKKESGIFDSDPKQTAFINDVRVSLLGEDDNEDTLLKMKTPLLGERRDVERLEEKMGKEDPLLVVKLKFSTTQDKSYWDTCVE